MYDKDRNVKSITYGNGDIVEYSYNDYNLVRNVKKNGKVVTTYHYNNRGEITKQTQDQVVNTYSYDNEGNLASLKTMNRGEEVYNITYAYDETNNLVQEIINGNENNYTYNENDELEISRKYIDGEVVKTTYGYDLFGNKTVLSSSEGKKTYTYNEENQLEKIETDDGFITYRYDDNGNITHKINEDGSKEVYRYDREDQLTHVQKGKDIYKYAYDAEGERITEVKIDVRDYPMLTWYNYTVNMEFEDVKKDHNETFEMLREQVAKREANDNTCDVEVTAHKETTYRKDPEITYYTLDRNQEHTVVLQENGESNVYANEEIVLSGDDKQVVGQNGSVIAEVDEDEEITTHSYSDYGVSNTKEEGHAYNGEYVQSNGLIYLRARYYDPTIGNFIQIDNNYAGEAENVATQNRYNYTLSNPYKYVDKDGNKVSKKPKSHARNQANVSPIIALASGVANSVKNTVTAANKAATQNQALKDITEGVRQVVDTVRHHLIGTPEPGTMEYEIYRTINDGINKVFKCIKPKEKSFLDQVGETIGDVGETIWDGVKTVGGALYDGAVWVGERLVDLGTALVEAGIAIATTVGGLLLDFALWISDYSDLLLGILSGLAMTAIVMFFFVPTGGLSLSLPTIVFGGGAIAYGTTTVVVSATTLSAVSATVIGAATGATVMAAASSSGSSGGSDSNNNSNNSSNQGSGNQDVLNEMKNRDSYYKSTTNSYDCSEIADELYDAAGGKGKIYEITSSKGELTVPEYGVNQKFTYHQVYSDGTYIYDPRYSMNPIPNDTYLNMLKQLNPNGIIIK